jgi:hypothetical protein
MLSGGDPTIWLRKTVRPSGRLYATLESDGQLSLVTEAGAPVRTVRPGNHQFVVWDKSPTDGIRLKGPNQDISTTTDYEGIQYWDVSLSRNSRYLIKSLTAPARSDTLRTSKR